MSTTTDYNELLLEIQAIQPADVMIPNMPVSVFVQESEDLYHWCRDDRDALINGGIDPDLIDQLPVRAGACREAQSLWIKERNTRQQAEQEWKVKAPEAFGLRNHLLHAFRYAFRKDPVLLGRVDEIAQGDTNSDMVQDLNDLSVLGKANLNLVTAVGVPVGQLDEAANVSDVMGDLLGATNGERDSTSEAMIIRDKAYTLLKQTVDEIRECGKYLFWQNPDRLKGYNSEHWRQANLEKAKVPVQD
jgi:hypothetical protein